MRQLKLVTIMFSLFFVLAACATEVSRTTTPPTPIPPTATATPKPTSTSTPTPSPTATPMPTATLPVPPPTPMPTLTPVPALLPLPPVSTQIQPHVFVGVARIGGQIAPMGTQVSAWVDGYSDPIGTTDVTGTGSFVLLAQQHGSILVSTQTSLSFRIGDNATIETDVWELGGATIIDLHIN